MRFLLVNANSAVKKIFDITAKKAGAELDVVDAIAKIPLDKDYACIFVDDGVMKTGDISNFKSKMITTKFCIILSKEAPIISGFDSYIRKPFLPTDIYEALKKEQYSDINNAIDEGEGDDTLGVGLDDSNLDGEIDANSDIDLSEFNDNNDEFLSGVKDVDSPSGIDFDGNPMGDSSILGDDGLDDSNLDVSNANNENIAGETDNFSDSNPNDAIDDFEIPHIDDFTDESVSADFSDLGNLGADLAQDVGNNANKTQDLAQNVAPLELDLGDNVDLDALVSDAKNIETQEMAGTKPVPDLKALQNAGIDLDFGNEKGAGSAADVAPDSAPNNSMSANSTPAPATQTPQKTEQDIFEEAESNIRNIKALSDKGGNFYNSAENHDDIDFSAIMALQEEILQEEAEKNKKKKLIGGDISTKKDDTQSKTTTAKESPEAVESIKSNDLTQDDSAMQNFDAQDFVDSSASMDSIASEAVESADFIESQVEPEAKQNAPDSIDLDLGIDSSVDSNSIDLAQDLNANLTQEVQDSTIDSTSNLAQSQENGIDLDFAQTAPAPELENSIEQDFAFDSNEIATISTPQDSIIQESPPAQEMAPQDDAQDSFLESLDFINDATSQEAPQEISLDDELPKDLTQDLDESALAKLDTESLNMPLDSQDDYNLDSLDSLADNDNDGLDALSAISNIVDDVPEPAPKNNDPNAILNNLEITTQDDIDLDYHANSTTQIPQSNTNQTQKNNLLNDSNYSFNSTFSQGISAELDSIAPSFEAQDFMQDLTLGTDTTLPDFTKSLKSYKTQEQQYNMLGLPINENGDIKDIKDLSQNELHNLDDEAILLLQEKSLKNKSAPQPPVAQSAPKATPQNTPKAPPKVLDKAQIDDITNILETTQGMGATKVDSNNTPKSISTPQSSEKPKNLSINNSEFDSLTQEALCEVLEEKSLDNMFGSGGDFATLDDTHLDSNVLDSSLISSAPLPNEPILPKQIDVSNGNLDIAELLQTFPIDKLRELLSGVQITVNITFPTKKQ